MASTADREARLGRHQRGAAMKRRRMLAPVPVPLMADDPSLQKRPIVEAIPAADSTIADLAAARSADLAEIAERIRARIKRTTADVIATGKDLLLAQQRLGTGNVLDWIERELGMTRRWAQLQMSVAKTFGEVGEIISSMPPTTIYKLAAPSTPDEIKAQVVADLEAGRIVDHRTVEAEIIDRRRVVRHQASLDRRPRRRSKAQSPAAQKYRAARERKAEATAAERQRAIDAAVDEAMSILSKLQAADLHRLRELVEEFGAYIVMRRLCGR